MDSNISLRPTKFNLVKKKVKKNNNNNDNNLKKNIKFKISQNDYIDTELKKLLFNILENVSNDNIILEMKNQIENNNYKNIINTLYIKYKFLLKFSIKEEIEKYIKNEKNDNNSYIEEFDEEEEKFFNFNENIAKINQHIDYSLLGNMEELHFNNEFNEDHEENIFSDEN